MKSTTLLLCCLLALSFVGCRGTTEAERMPVSADTIGKMLGDAEKELVTVRRRHATLDIAPEDRVELERLAMGVQAQIREGRKVLLQARQTVDVDKLKLAGDLTIQTFPLLQELQDAGILAEHAAMSER